MIEVHNQKELDDALKNYQAEEIVCRDGYFMLSGNSRATLSGNSRATLSDNSRAEASPYCAVVIDSENAKVTGGVQIKIPKVFTPQVWCDYNGVEVVDGVAILYKALDENYKSGYGAEYRPGTIPIAPDWDGGRKECGGGYHFCASPRIARDRFNNKATKFSACPVALADCATITNPEYRDKIKAQGCCAPIWEVDIDGNKLGVQNEEAGL